MPQRGPQRGDFTGAQRQRLADENAKELAQRQEEIGLVNQVDFVTDEEGVFDPATGTMVEMSAEGQARIEDLSQPIEVDEDPILDPSATPAYDPMKNLQAVGVQQQARPQPTNPLEVIDLGDEPVTVEEEWKVIRVNTDIEQMTYGIGNEYTFVRGKRYRVPFHLYQWLESRGVVYH
jgi:hypothetical protein